MKIMGFSAAPEAIDQQRIATNVIVRSHIVRPSERSSGASSGRRAAPQKEAKTAEPVPGIEAEQKAFSFSKDGGDRMKMLPLCTIRPERASSSEW